MKEFLFDKEAFYFGALLPSIRQVTERRMTFGSSRSGKTSSSGEALAKIFLLAGFSDQVSCDSDKE